MKLTNLEVWQAYPSLVALSQNKLPVKASFDVAMLQGKLLSIYQVIERERVRLVEQYGVKDDGTGNIEVNKASQEDRVKFADELSELLKIDNDVDVKAIKLPSTVAATCDKCNHNMDKPFELEPNVLLPLVNKLVEVV